MIFLKLMGCALIICSALSAVYYINLKLSRHAQTVEGWLEFIRYVRCQVEFFSMPATDILKRCEKELLLKCGLLGADKAESFAELAQKVNIDDEEVKEITSGFLLGFGKSYRDGQLRECDYYTEILSAHLQKINKELPVKKKLNTTLCICAALGILIVFI